MSKYTDIIEQVKREIKEDGVGGTNAGAMSTGVVGPTTAQDGNTSIDYIPGGFTSKKKMKRTLGKEQDNGKVEVIEQRSELIHNLYSKLTRVLTIDLRENKQIKRTIHLLNYWLSLFPQSKYLPISSPVAVNLGSYDRSIRELIDRIKNIYSDDVGNLEMLMANIRQDMPLNAYEPFAEFDYVIGVRVQSQYNGIVMIMELTVNLAMVPTQSIYIESSEVLDEIESYRTIKVLNDMVFPIGQMFQPSIFHNIKDIIDDLNEEPKEK